MAPHPLLALTLYSRTAGQPASLVWRGAPRTRGLKQVDQGSLQFNLQLAERAARRTCSYCGPAGKPEEPVKTWCPGKSAQSQASEDFLQELSEAPLPGEAVPSLVTAAGAVVASQQAPPCSGSSYSPNPDPNKNEEK